MMMPLDGGNPNVAFLNKPFQVSVLTDGVHQRLAAGAIGSEAVSGTHGRRAL